MTGISGIASTRVACGNCGAGARWIGCTPFGDQYICMSSSCRRRHVTFKKMAIAQPDANVTNVNTCLVCGGEFESVRSGAKTCSSRCRKALSRR